MKLFGNRKHKQSKTVLPTFTPAVTETDLSATAILSDVQEELRSLDTVEQLQSPPADTAPSTGGETKKSWWGRRTGLQRGLIILALALVVLGGTVFAIWKTVVKPPEGTTIDSASAESIIQAVEGREPAVVEAGTNPDSDETASVLVGETDPEEDLPEETESEPEEYTPTTRLEGTYNVLLCGTDGDDGRTDTIMLASFDVTDHQLNILSIPRDTMYLSGSRVAKINSAYGSGGRGVEGIEYLAAKLTTMLGVPIDAYVLVDLKAFVEVVDLIGGVWFDVPQDMNYEDPYQDLYIHLTTGYQHLDGEKCMELVRFRSYPQADIQRVSVQQDFLKAVMDQCMSIGNVTKVREFAAIISENMTTNLTLGSMVDLGMELLKVNLDEVVFCTLPGEGYTYSDGGAYYVLYRYNTLNMLNEYFNPYDRTLTIDDVSMVYKSGGSIIMPSGRTYSAASSGTNSGLSTQTPTVTQQTTTEEQTDETAEASEDAEQTEQTDSETLTGDAAEETGEAIDGNEGESGFVESPDAEGGTSGSESEPEQSEAQEGSGEGQAPLENVTDETPEAQTQPGGEDSGTGTGSGEDAPSVTVDFE